MDGVEIDLDAGLVVKAGWSYEQGDGAGVSTGQRVNGLDVTSTDVGCAMLPPWK